MKLLPPKKPQVIVYGDARSILLPEQWEKACGDLDDISVMHHCTGRRGHGLRSVFQRHSLRYALRDLRVFDFGTQDDAENFLATATCWRSDERDNGMMALSLDIQPKAVVDVYLRPQGVTLMRYMGHIISVGEEVAEQFGKLCTLLDELVQRHEGEPVTGRVGRLLNPGHQGIAFQWRAAADDFSAAIRPPIFNCRPWLHEAAINGKWVVKPPEMD